MSSERPLVIRVGGPLLGVFLVGFDAMAVSLTLPSIQADLDASFATLQWVVAAYFLAIAATVITAGRLGDLHGRRRVFMIGLVVFGAASTVCALAPSAEVLLVGRVGQGLGAASLYSLSLALTTAAVPREQIGRGVAAWATSGGLSMATAPLLAGALIDAFDWRAVFIVNVPIVIVALGMSRSFLKESTDPDAQPGVDVPGIATLSAGLAMLMLAFTQADAWGWGSAATIAVLAGSALMLGAFLVVESRVPNPLVDLDVFLRNGPFVGANFMAVAAYFSVYVLLFVTSLYLQDIRGDSPLGAGLRLLPFPIVFAITSQIAGRLVNRVGPLLPMVLGAGVMGAGLVMLSFADADTGELALAAAFVVFGAGMGLALVSISAAALGSVPAGKIGAASGIRATSAYVGSGVGVALTGAVLTLRERMRLGEITEEEGRRLTGDEQREIDGVLAGSDAARARLDDFSPLQADQIVAAAADAFTAGMATALRMCAVLLGLGALTAVLLVRRSRHRRPAPHGHATLPPPEEPHAKALAAETSSGG